MLGATAPALARIAAVIHGFSEMYRTQLAPATGTEAIRALAAKRNLRRSIPAAIVIATALGKNIPAASIAGKAIAEIAVHPAIIQSFKPGEITPELALEIAQTFVAEHLADYEVVIGVHVDKEHIHAHMIFNSVNQATGRKYHSNAKSYYQQIRVISDRLCREHGLSVITGKARMANRRSCRKKQPSWSGSTRCSSPVSRSR